MRRWQIEMLKAVHDRTAFDCGQESLNQWLKYRAGQWDRKELARCYVAIPAGQFQVIGHSTVSSHYVSYELLPAEQVGRCPAPRGIAFPTTRNSCRRGGCDQR